MVEAEEGEARRRIRDGHFRLSAVRFCIEFTVDREHARGATFVKINLSGDLCQKFNSIF